MDEEHSESMEGLRKGWRGTVDLQNNPDCGPGPLGSDENQNQLMEDGEEEIGRRLRTGWKPSQQDSVNNNEEEEELGNRLADNNNGPLPKTLTAGTWDSPVHSTWGTTDSGATGAAVGPAVTVSSCLDRTSESSLRGGPCVTGPSPSLVALLQQLAEHSDYTLLPQCLHQIAEAFALEGDYEWAVQFIRMERLYHERLLSNLAGLQEQWEIHCKVESSVGTAGTWLEPERLETLTRICRTHQRSTLQDKKCVAVDKELQNSLCHVRPDAEPPLCVADRNCESPGTIKALTMEETSLTQGAPALGLQQEDSSTLDHWGEVMHSPHPLTIPTSNKTDRHCPDDSASVGGGEAETRYKSGLSGASGGLLADSTSQPEGEGRVDLTAALPVPLAAAHTAPVAVWQAEGCDSGCYVRQTDAGPDGPPVMEGATASGDMDRGGADSGLGHEMSSLGVEWLGEGKDESSTGAELAEDGEEKPEIVEVEVTEESSDYDLEDNGLGVDEGGEAQAGEAGRVPHDSLDDLAKRIQVEEITPALGLVSILKRRTFTDAADTTAPQKQTSKRKVRFREPDEMPDQDEVGGDSWFLLLLLCLATVVISMGGTALYCALGDVQSSVCTDFSRNVDFYFSQMQRGLDELRHWLSPGPS